MRIEPGGYVGPYHVLGPLGAGGMGEVYLAEDPVLERRVAIKRLASASEDPTGARRILEEAKAAASLSHPNVAAVYGFLDTEDGPCIVMEYVDGETLATRLRQGPIAMSEALRIARQICDGIESAHRHGIVHRDLKPSNICLGHDGRAKVLDFGIARRTRRAGPGVDVASQEALTEPGHAIGTPGYMAPEQLVGGSKADARTDVFGLGAVLYEMLTGRRPYTAFEGDLLGAVLAKAARPLPASTFVPSIPASVDELLARAVALEPSDRFQSASELGGALDSAIRGLSDLPTRQQDTVHPAAQGSYSAGPAMPTRPVWGGRTLVWVTVCVIAAVATIYFGYLRPRTRGASPIAALAAPRPVVALLPFGGAGDDHRARLLGSYLADTVAASLAQVRTLHVLSRQDVSAVTAGEGGDPSRMARELGADVLVTGSVSRRDQDLAVSLDVWAAGKPGRRVEARAPAGDLGALSRKLGEGVRDALGRAGVEVSTPVGTSGAGAAQGPDPEAYADYDQGRAFLSRPDVPGNAERARTLFESATAKDRRFALAYAALGEAHLAIWRETRNEQWVTRAKEAYLEALRLDPERPEIRISLAELHRELGELDKAVEELQRAARARPEHDAPHRLLGGIFADQNRSEEAIAELREAVRLRPSYWRNHSELGYASYRAGRVSDAIASYERVTELQPDSTLGFHMLGTIYQLAGDSARALENYSRAHALRPDADTLSNMGTLHYWRGEYAEAQRDYEQAIEMRPADGGLHHNLGDVFRKTNRPERARAAYDRAVVLLGQQLKVNPRDVPVLAQVAIVHAKAGDRASADAMLRRALNAGPNDADTQYAAAVVRTLAGDAPAGCESVAAALKLGYPAILIRHDDDLAKLAPMCQPYRDAVASVSR